jgi:hypothetical protein
MNTEPIYVYTKGEGWRVQSNLHYLDQPCEILDLREYKNQPGVWKYQIWLVDVRDYKYRDWLDHHNNYTWKTLEAAKEWNDKPGPHFLGIFQDGMRQRFVNVGASVNDYYPAFGRNG